MVREASMTERSDSHDPALDAHPELTGYRPPVACFTTRLRWALIVRRLPNRKPCMTQAKVSQASRGATRAR